MQVGDVLGGLELREDGAFVLGAAVGDDGVGLVAVAGEDDVVEEVFGVVFELEDDFGVDVFEGDDGVVQVDAVGREAGQDGVDVLGRAAGDGHPVGTAGECGEEVMVVHEADEGDCGKIECALVCRCRPNGRGHGNDVVVFEGPAVVLAIAVRPNGLVGSGMFDGFALLGFRAGSMSIAVLCTAGGIIFTFV